MQLPSSVAGFEALIESAFHQIIHKSIEAANSKMAFKRFDVPS